MTPARHFALDAEWLYLNHGSFGACPLPILAEQARLRLEMERQPVRFLDRELAAGLAAARQALADFVGAEPEGLAFVPNATHGVNIALAAQAPQPGAEWLICDQEYNACKNAATFHAARCGATLKIVPLPFPVESEETLEQAFLAALSPRTRLVLFDHVTSPTALVLPIARWVAAAKEIGATVIVDGAHALGMLPLDLRQLGADFYTANAHKWLCAPKGSAFLYVAPQARRGLHPLVISHGLNAPRAFVDPFRAEFDWPGTFDPTPYLCLPACLDFLGGLLAGGWEALRRHNHQLAVEARRLLLDVLEIPAPCPESLLGSMAALPLPDDPHVSENPLLPDPVQVALRERFRIEIPVMRWPAAPQRLIRLSAQVYNDRAQYEQLGRALLQLRAEGLLG